MSSSFTTTSSFTTANARRVAAKLQADLGLMRRAYGRPNEEEIEQYGQEATLMLAKGYLGTVTYGFKKDSAWIVALRYTANNDGTLVSDDRAGRVPRGVDTSGAAFYSYLTYSAKKSTLDPTEWEAFATTLPFRRGGAPEPGTSGGYWASDNTYSSNGSGLSRTTFKPL